MLNEENLGGTTQETVAPEVRAAAATVAIRRGRSWRGSRIGFRALLAEASCCVV